MSEEQSYTVGEQLRMRREALGQTLADVAEKTCIRKVYLAHIEADEFNALPGAAYVTGFIRTYSRFLDLPSDPLVEALHAQEGATDRDAGEPFATSDLPLPGVPAAKSKRGLSMFLAGLLFVLVIGGALYYLLGTATAS